MTKFVLIDLGSGSNIRVTLMQGRRSVTKRSIEFSTEDPLRLTQIHQPLRTAMRDLQAFRTPAVIAVPRSWVLLLPMDDASAATAAQVFHSLPPAFSDAYHAKVTAPHGGTALAVFAPVQWNACLTILRDLGLPAAGAVFGTGPRLLEDIIDGRAAWLVPPPKSVWRRLSWTPRLERRLTIATLVLLIGGLGLGRWTDSLRERRGALEQAVRQRNATQMVGLSSPLLISIVTDIANRLPRESHLTEFTFDGALKRLRLRGRSSNFDRVSELVAALGSMDTVASCRPERSTSIKVGQRSVVEFALEVILK